MISWKVFNEDINKRKIVEYDVFTHYNFLKGISKVFKDIDKMSKEDKPQKDIDMEFNERVRRECLYYFWGKCEWEIILTDWPPHIIIKEVERLNKEVEDHVKNWGIPARSVTPDLEVSRKIDVYDQLQLNWEVFLQYVKDHRKEILKKYRDLKKKYEDR